MSVSRARLPGKITANRAPFLFTENTVQMDATVGGLVGLCPPHDPPGPAIPTYDLAGSQV